MRSRAPEVSETLRRQVVTLVQQLRDRADLQKPPGVAETLDWARRPAPPRHRRARPRLGGRHAGRAREVPRGRRAGEAGAGPDVGDMTPRAPRAPRAPPACRRDPARLHPRAASGRRPRHPRSRPRLPRGGRPARPRRPAGDVPRGAGDALRRTRRPRALRPGLRGVVQRSRRTAAAPTRSAGATGALRPARDRLPGGGRARRRRAVARAGQRHRGAAPPRRRPALRRREATARRDVRDPASALAAAAYRPARVLATRSARRLQDPAREPAATSASRPRSPGAAAVCRPRRVVLLVDVSGSMSGYADPLLRLAHRFSQVARGRRGVVETFTIGTRLTHLTRAMRLRDPERSIVAAGETVPGLVRRHPPGRDAAVLPRSLGAARDGPRCGGRGVQRRLGAR